MFSIDPLTARDLDDALSIERSPWDPQGFRVGVHIADVAHFVRAGTPLDDEARERGTSVYLVDRVIPMLPRALCEHLCSLNPGACAAPCMRVVVLPCCCSCCLGDLSGQLSTLATVRGRPSCDLCSATIS